MSNRLCRCNCVVIALDVVDVVDVDVVMSNRPWRWSEDAVVVSVVSVVVAVNGNRLCRWCYRVVVVDVVMSNRLWRWNHIVIVFAT